jgi:prepilin peptidase CpaA
LNAYGAYETFFCIFLLISFIWDVQKQVLPNRWIAWNAGSAVLLHLFIDGWPGFSASAFGAVAGLMLTVPLWAVGGIGAGDSKWFAGAGAWLGVTDTAVMLATAIVLSGMLALVYFLASSKFRVRCYECGLLLWLGLHDRFFPSIVDTPRSTGVRGVAFPFMFAVLPSAGLLFAVRWWRPELLEVW